MQERIIPEKVQWEKFYFLCLIVFPGLKIKLWNKGLKKSEEPAVFLQNHVWSTKSGSAILRGAARGSRRIAEKIEEALQNDDSMDEMAVNAFVQDSIELYMQKEKDPDSFKELREEMVQRVEEILALPESVIKQEILSRYFQNTFHGQINSLLDSGTDACLELLIKKQPVKLCFTDNECRIFKTDIPILNKAIYIDNPFIIDNFAGYNDLNPMEEFLKELLTEGERIHCWMALLNRYL